MNKKEIIQLINEDKLELDNLSEKVKKNKDIFLYLVKKHAYALKYADNSLTKDKQIVLENSQVRNECDTALLNVKRNRANGMIESTAKRIGACDGSSFTTSTKFKGKCK